MAGSNKESRGGDNKNSLLRENLLVLGIDQSGKIVQFNKECEKIAGYSKTEVLNREILNFLIPERCFEQWRGIFDSAKRNKSINDFKLPLLDRYGHEVMVLWSGFPVENDGGIMEIVFTGKLVNEKDDVKGSVIEHVKNKVENKIESGHVNKKYENVVLFKFGNKRILFRKKNVVDSRDTLDDVKTKVLFKKGKKLESDKNKLKKRVNVEEKMIDEGYNGYKNTINKLERENRELIKENKKLEKNLKSLKTRWDKKKEEVTSKKHVSSGRKPVDLFGKRVNFLFDSRGGGRKKEEFERMMRELDERKRLLDDLETQLFNDKKSLNERRNEFCRWRGKLELLEDEIEKRREDLVEQEKMFSELFVSSLDEGVRDESAVSDHIATSDSEVDRDGEERHGILDKIPDCAVVIQRGILKQINDSFAELVGYKMEEIVEKSLFDFIAPEGLAEVKKYYLKRLKGDEASSFETVFSTKDNDKVAVEVSTKPTTFNGEKAEIAVFKKLGNQIKEAIEKD